MEGPETAVVIRAFNEERHLNALFDALDKQAYRDFETIVVDSGSTDLTPRIAERRADRLIAIDSRDFTFGYSLNTGIRSTAAKFVAIVSAHAIPITPEWLARLIAPCREPSTAMVYGSQRGVSSTKYSEARDFLRTFGSARVAVDTGRFFANNANAAVRRELWAQHPFDEELPGLEDIEWARYWIQRGLSVLYEPDAGIYHIHEETWRQVRHRYFREAVAQARLGIATRRSAFTDVLVEARRAVSDVVHAGREGVLLERLAEILRFRYEKAVGHVSGLLTQKDFGDVDVRQRELFDRYQRALVVRGPKHIDMEEVPIPALRPGEVLVKVAYAGICGTDLEIVDGSLGYFRSGLSTYPLIPGHEFSGRIMAAGARSGDWRIGDPVVVECIQSCGLCDMCEAGNAIGCVQRSEVGVMRRDGAFAEYVAVPGRFAHRLSADTPLRVAALCEPIAVVLKGLRRLSPFLATADARTVIGVVGGGPIGYLTAMILERQGHSVVVFDQRASRRALYQQSEATLDRIGEMHAVVEATGDASALDIVLRRGAAGAPVLLLGLPYARREFNFESVVAYDKILIGSIGSASKDFDAAVRLIDDLPLHPLLNRAIPLAQFETALEEAHRREYLKVMLEIDSELENYAVHERADETVAASRSTPGGGLA